MKGKYIEERFPRYFIHGDNGSTVDVMDGENYVLVGVSRENAERVIAERDKVVDAIIEVSSALDAADSDAFKRIWYSSK